MPSSTSRMQGFTTAPYRAPTRHQIRMGATPDGKITAFGHEGWELTSRVDNYAVAGVETTSRIYGYGTVATKVNLVRADRLERRLLVLPVAEGDPVVVEHVEDRDVRLPEHQVPAVPHLPQLHAGALAQSRRRGVARPDDDEAPQLLAAADDPHPDLVRSAGIIIVITIIDVVSARNRIIGAACITGVDVRKCGSIGSARNGLTRTVVSSTQRGG